MPVSKNTLRFNPFHLTSFPLAITHISIHLLLTSMTKSHYLETFYRQIMKMTKK